MADDVQDPIAPLSPQPATTTIPGLEIETGYVRRASPDPRAALEAEDQRIFGLAAPADLDVLRRACQASADTMPLKRWYDGEEIADGPAWQGIRVEITAFPLVPHPIDGSLRAPLNHPWVYQEFPRIDGPCIIARWLHRYPGHDGVLEVTWDGRRLFATRVRRSVHFYGGGDASDAARLLALWTTDRPHIRSRRDRALDLEQAVLVTIRLMEGGHQPTEAEVQEAVADIECVGPDAIRSRWRRAAPRISIGEVRGIAKERAPLLHLSNDPKTA